MRKLVIFGLILVQSTLAANGIASGPFEVYYGAAGSPVSYSNISAYGDPNDNNRLYGPNCEAQSVGNGEALPWAPVGSTATKLVCDGQGEKTGTSIYTIDHDASFESIAQGWSLGYYLHLKGFDATRVSPGAYALFGSAIRSGATWSYQNIYYKKGDQGDTLFSQYDDDRSGDTKGPIYVLVDSLNHLIPPSLVANPNEWVGIEMRLKENGGSPDIPLDFYAKIAGKEVYFRNQTNNVLSKFIPPTVDNFRPANSNEIACNVYGMNVVGDFARVGPVTEADQRFASDRFLTLERAYSVVNGSKVVIPADTIVEPVISSILYAPPGNASSVTLNSQTTLGASYSTAEDISASVRFGVGITVKPEALTGECGIEAEVAAKVSASVNWEHAIDGSITVAKKVTLNPGASDQVIYDMLRLRLFVLRHARLDHVFEVDPGAENFVAFPIVVPDPMKQIKVESIQNFLKLFRGDTAAIWSLMQVYAKDTATGLVNQNHPVVKGVQPTLTGYIGNSPVVMGGSVGMSKKETKKTSYKIGLGVEASAKLTAGGVSASMKFNADISNTTSNGVSESQEMLITYTISDNASWNEYHYKTWVDSTYGTAIFEWDSSASYAGGYPSYSTANWDSHSRRSVKMNYFLTGPDSVGQLIDGDPLVRRLVMTNATQYAPRDPRSSLLPYVSPTPFVVPNSTGSVYSVRSDLNSPLPFDPNQTSSMNLSFDAPPSSVRTPDTGSLAVKVGYQLAGTGVPTYVTTDLVHFDLRQGVATARPFDRVGTFTIQNRSLRLLLSGGDAVPDLATTGASDSANLWLTIPDSSKPGLVRFRNAKTGLYLAASTDTSVDSLFWSAYSPSPSQQWIVTQDTLVINRLSGKFLSVASSWFPIRQSVRSGTLNQGWVLNPAQTDAIRPRRVVSGALEARIGRAFAKPARGAASGRLGTGVEGCENGGCQTIETFLPRPGAVGVVIFDNLGTKVISWTKEFSASDLGRLAATADGRRIVPLNWNLRSTSGIAVPEGVYLWMVSVTLDDGSELRNVYKLGVRE